MRGEGKRKRKRKVVGRYGGEVGAGEQKWNKGGERE